MNVKTAVVCYIAAAIVRAIVVEFGVYGGMVYHRSTALLCIGFATIQSSPELDE
jgi:hypothetical protein